ncbi:redoxin domain-containing protein [Rufibacter sediminis]|uniref:Redoxin domain-containing protein n=1 Tax=Rufibacter sediminis TaxID=2762756 RepID=A0ABR6VS37_9BACT|nr:redoxin domain-containing protein [Rufibacter sediminis]MBC3539951.1 redoxin domain-containing protein [Rufibacter sediminis]
MRSFFTFLIAFFFTTGAFAQSGYRLGAKVDNFTLKDAQHQAVELSSFKDTPLVVVVFTSVSCPYSKLYENRLQSLSKAYSGKGAKFVYVNTNIGLEEGSQTDKAQPDRPSTQNFPYLIDEGQQLSKQFGATKAPEVFVLQNSNDGFYLRYKGAIDDNPQAENYVKERYLAGALDALLAGRSVANSERRATGCLIKRF